MKLTRWIPDPPARSKIRSNEAPLVEYFPDFTGQPGDLEAAKQYMKHKFVSLSRKKDRGLYVHLTCVSFDLGLL